MTEEMTQNYKNVLALVKKGFYLTKESQELFEQILFNQEYAEEYKKIAEQPDKRLFIDIDYNILKKYDSSFARLYTDYPDFCKSYELTYEQYSKGIVKDGTKILKAIKKFYSTKNINLLKDMLQVVRKEHPKYNIQEDFFKVIFNKAFISKDYENYSLSKNYSLNDEEWTLFSDNNEKIYFKARNLLTDKNVSLKKKISDKKYSDLLKDTGIFEKFTSVINKKYLSLRIDVNYKLCLSLNYADWLLASTNNSWSSCISLVNSSGYWAGLAGLVGDKNRIMIFITDMKEKTFHDIKSYNMIERMWAFTMKQAKDVSDEENKKTYIFQNKLYPRKENFSLSLIKDYFTNVEIYKEVAQPRTILKSKYDFPSLFHIISDDGNGKGYKPPQYDSFSSCIYEDTLSKIPANKEHTMMKYTSDQGDNICCYAFSSQTKRWHNVGNNYMYDCSIDDIPAM